MPYANNQGIRIHYEIDGEGPPLVLQHGSAGSGKDWYQFGYADALKHDYQLILMDIRGRGASDKPHDSAAYALVHYVADIVTVLNDLHIRTARFFGYSLGGAVGFGMAKYAAERVHALIIGGAHPYARSADVLAQLDVTDPEAFLSAYEARLGERFTPEWRTRMLANDLRALQAAAQARPSIEEVLPTMTRPCLLYVGDTDTRAARVRECAQHIPNGTMVCLPGLNHAQAYARSELVLPHIIPFLRQVDTRPQTVV
jgi:pimeloyl-ACP methyl ester carboxylesterase